MKKILMFTFLFSTICFNVLANRNDYIGAWYYYHEKLESDVFLLVQDFEDTLFVSIISDKSSVNVLGLAEFNGEQLVVHRLNNKTQIYSYDDENNRLVLSYTRKDGIERYKYYYKVDDDKLSNMQKSFQVVKDDSP